MKRALVLGGAGFIGTHLVRQLKSEGYYVRTADIKPQPYHPMEMYIPDSSLQLDLRDPEHVQRAFTIPGDLHFDEVYQLAADMGGWQHIFSGDHDADIVHNSALININVAKQAVDSMTSCGKLFFSSSACVYPQGKQTTIDSRPLKESDAFPADPDSPYGWEKIFSEVLYDSFARNYGLDIRIARFHNIFGPLSTFGGGRQKAPADICRQVAEATDGGHITLNGDGEQCRSFLYIKECLQGVRRLMDSDFDLPINIGSSEMVTINDLAKMVIDISGKKVGINYVESTALGVRMRNSDNTTIKEVLNWKPSEKLYEGLKKTYMWVNIMVQEMAANPDIPCQYYPKPKTA